MPFKFNPFTGTLDYYEVGTSPAGSDRQIQFNDSGSFGGAVNVTYDSSGNFVLKAGTKLIFDGA